MKIFDGPVFFICLKSYYIFIFVLLIKTNRKMSNQESITKRRWLLYLEQLEELKKLEEARKYYIAKIAEGPKPGWEKDFKTLSDIGRNLHSGALMKASLEVDLRFDEIPFKLN